MSSLQNMNPGAPEVSSEERTLALVAHLSFFVAPVIGPLILWAIKKDQSQFIAYHSLQATIYQGISAVVIFGAWIIIGILTTIISMFCPCGIIGFFLPMIFLMLPFYGIYPAIKAYGGEWMGYLFIDKYGRPPGV